MTSLDADFPARLRPALSCLLATCRDDRRVRSAWLEGSLARGFADDWSDIDLHLVVQNAEGFDAVEWLGSFMPLVLADAIPGLQGAFICLTPEWIHIDLNIHSMADDVPPAIPRRVLLDRDDRIRDMPAIEPVPGQPFFPRQQVQIFLYFMGSAVATLHRGDLIALSMTTAMMRDRLLVPLMLAENGIEDGTRTKRLNRYLSDEQMASLQLLPAIGLGNDGLREAQQAIATEYLGRARRLADACCAEWPANLEQATRRLWHDELGIDV